MSFDKRKLAAVNASLLRHAPSLRHAKNAFCTHYQTFFVLKLLNQYLRGAQSVCCATHNWYFTNLAQFFSLLGSSSGDLLT
jgi:hypothetical protein